MQLWMSLLPSILVGQVSCVRELAVIDDFPDSHAKLLRTDASSDFFSHLVACPFLHSSPESYPHSCYHNGQLLKAADMTPVKPSLVSECFSSDTGSHIVIDEDIRA